ncbi:hypothetical protein HNQ94_000692 [Salirhabdus euzebyi]|uniref:DUF1798 family protein n=1 Tax=Salirhabdus euzebyi TaxID=394506 RepID=A0A841PTC8_9BACI|nr:DUF1798 family protein [Salirhabdus euzebyi]MBB6452247.1 hypothetical protein [Salirhabdus euzebyi]
MNSQLANLIDQIYEEVLAKGLERFDNGNAIDKKSREGFEQVKVQTKHPFSLIDKWEEETLAAIPELPIYPNQVQNTKENMELLLLHSYYHDVKRKRFMELYHSIDYVMNQMKGKP